MLRARLKVSTLVSAVTAVTLAADPGRLRVEPRPRGRSRVWAAAAAPPRRVSSTPTAPSRAATPAAARRPAATPAAARPRAGPRPAGRPAAPPAARPGGTTGGTGGGGGDARASGDGSATGGGKGASCDGFKNGPGITDTEITIGNSSDISGPVPGLFESAQDATKAYVAYFNSTSDICGRKLKLVTYDSRTDAAADQQAYTRACDEVFAMVGSMSAFDSGGAGDRAGLRAARHPLGGGDQRAQRLHDLLRRPVDQHRRAPERGRGLHPQELRQRRPARRVLLHQRRRGGPERARPGRAR